MLALGDISFSSSSLIILSYSSFILSLFIKSVFLNFLILLLFLFKSSLLIEENSSSCLSNDLFSFASLSLVILCSLDIFGSLILL